MALADPGSASNGAADSRLLCGVGEESFTGEVTCTHWFPSAQTQQTAGDHTGNTAAARGGRVTPRYPLPQRGWWELFHSWIAFWCLLAVYIQFVVVSSVLGTCMFIGNVLNHLLYIFAHFSCLMYWIYCFNLVNRPSVCVCLQVSCFTLMIQCFS